MKSLAKKFLFLLETITMAVSFLFGINFLNTKETKAADPVFSTDYYYHLKVTYNSETLYYNGSSSLATSDSECIYFRVIPLYSNDDVTFTDYGFYGYDASGNELGYLYREESSTSLLFDSTLPHICREHSQRYRFNETGTDLYVMSSTTEFLGVGLVDDVLTTYFSTSELPTLANYVVEQSSVHNVVDTSISATSVTIPSFDLSECDLTVTSTSIKIDFSPFIPIETGLEMGFIGYKMTGETGLKNTQDNNPNYYEWTGLTPDTSYGFGYVKYNYTTAYYLYTITDGKISTYTETRDGSFSDTISTKKVAPTDSTTKFIYSNAITLDSCTAGNTYTINGVDFVASTGNTSHTWTGLDPLTSYNLSIEGTYTDVNTVPFTTIASSTEEVSFDTSLTTTTSLTLTTASGYTYQLYSKVDDTYVPLSGTEFVCTTSGTKLYSSLSSGTSYYVVGKRSYESSYDTSKAVLTKTIYTAPSGISYETTPSEDGKVVVTGVDSSMEYSLDSGTTWNAITSTTVNIAGSSSVDVRVASTITGVTNISTSLTLPSVTTSPSTTYSAGVISSLAANQDYELTVTDSEGVSTKVTITPIDTDYAVFDDQNLIDKAGQTITSIVRKGDGLNAIDSTKQTTSYTLITRPSSPSEILFNSTPSEDGKVSSTNMGSLYEYSINGGNSWVKCLISTTYEPGTAILFRLSATTSLPCSESTSFNIPTLKSTPISTYNAGTISSLTVGETYIFSYTLTDGTSGNKEMVATSTSLDTLDLGLPSVATISSITTKGDETLTINSLKQDVSYTSYYKEVTPQAVVSTSIEQALGKYEISSLTPNATYVVVDSTSVTHTYTADSEGKINLLLDKSLFSTSLSSIYKSSTGLGSIDSDPQYISISIPSEAALIEESKTNATKSISDLIDEADLTDAQKEELKTEIGSEIDGIDLTDIDAVNNKIEEIKTESSKMITVEEYKKDGVESAIKAIEESSLTQDQKDELISSITSSIGDISSKTDPSVATTSISNILESLTKNISFQETKNDVSKELNDLLAECGDDSEAIKKIIEDSIEEINSKTYETSTSSELTAIIEETKNHVDYEEKRIDAIEVVNSLNRECQSESTELEEIINQAVDSINNMTYGEDAITGFGEVVSETKDKVEVYVTKINASTSLSSFASSLLGNNTYSSENQEKINEIVDKYSKAIANATSVDEVNRLLSQAKSEIANIQVERPVDYICIITLSVIVVFIGVYIYLSFIRKNKEDKDGIDLPTILTTLGYLFIIAILAMFTSYTLRVITISIAFVVFILAIGFQIYKYKKINKKKGEVC